MVMYVVWARKNRFSWSTGRRMIGIWHATPSTRFNRTTGMCGASVYAAYANDLNTTHLPASADVAGVLDGKVCPKCRRAVVDLVDTTVTVPQPEGDRNAAT